MKPKKVPERANMGGNDEICHRVSGQDQSVFVNADGVQFAIILLFEESV